MNILYFSCVAYPHLCYTLRHILASDLTYATPSFWISKDTRLPRHKWTIKKMAVWNLGARLHLNDHSSTWIKDLAHDTNTQPSTPTQL